jgi:excisionase family DNA binding protein
VDPCIFYNGKNRGGAAGGVVPPRKRAVILGSNERRRKMNPDNMFGTFQDLLTINDVQKALGVGRSMAYRLINSGRIQHLRVGKSIKVPKRFLVDFVLSSCYTTAIATDPPSIKEVLIYDGE